MDQAGESSSRESLERSLIGRLPCVVCGYNLQSLSVLGRCPECGTAVRATILAMVDPLAEELRPITRPRLTAVLVVLWAFSALLAVMLAWYQCLAAAFPGLRPGAWGPPQFEWGNRAVAIAIAVSALGALGMVRPHAAVPVRATWSALIAVAAHIPLAILAEELILRMAESFHRGLPDPWFGTPRATILRLAACGLVLAIIAGLRPNARLLVARCLALRTGRVDRQTMLAMAAAVSLFMLGDGLGFATRTLTGVARDILRTGAGTLMVVGALLLTLGLAGALVDCLRIASSLLTPPPGPRQIMSAHGQDDPGPIAGAGDDPASIGGGQ